VRLSLITILLEPRDKYRKLQSYIYINFASNIFFIWYKVNIVYMTNLRTVCLKGVIYYFQDWKYE